VRARAPSTVRALAAVAASGPALADEGQERWELRAGGARHRPGVTRRSLPLAESVSR
jgi:hypothetical protein